MKSHYVDVTHCDGLPAHVRLYEKYLTEDEDYFSYIKSKSTGIFYRKSEVFVECSEPLVVYSPLDFASRTVYMV